MPLYAVTIFLSAFLLFQVQPLIAKVILPWFGGSAAVWTICMLFFQLLLLAGYLYAHWLIRRFEPGRQAWIHIALLMLSLLTLPAEPNVAWKPGGTEDPTFRILGLLGATIGLPYFLLSTTGPLLQAWFSRQTSATPYRLYALSNAGSMLALLSYPFLFEPYLATHVQELSWSGGYVVFALLAAAVTWLSRGFPVGDYTNQSSDAEPPSRDLMIIWVLLAACASTLLLAVTNHVTQNVASIPFLWVLPLSLYLLSFILCFDSDRWYKRKLFLGLFAVAIGVMAYAVFQDTENMPIRVALPLFATGLFICCMVCHGELVRAKPHPRYLTLFYLMVSAGGAVGGIFVGLIAPRVFVGYFEMPIALVGTAVLVLIILHRDPTSSLYQARWSFAWITLYVLVMVLVFDATRQMRGFVQGTRLALRNFYGGLRVADEGSGVDATRTLTNGTINHGEQYLDPSKRRRATTYYAPQSGVGIAILNRDRHTPHRIGIIGLGTGTLATYGQPGDEYRFYEINPLVLKLAETDFAFLRDSQAKIVRVLGDARLSLEREPAQNFDVIAVDAFSSDSIPVHLLTIEAFRLYFQHLKPDGILAVHVSNKFLDLVPIVALAAKELGKEARIIDTDDDEEDSIVFGATWILVTADKSFFERPKVMEAVQPLKAPPPGLRLWTDDYSNLYKILK